MKELAEIKKRTKPHNVLLVVDAMTGQDAVNVAEQFAETANFDGVVLTKLDGDARGGAALSVKAVTGKPILYASTGEKLGDFERFHPDRMAQRILGMGDVMTLVEKAERQMDERQAAELEQKIRKEQFTLDDFLEQMQQVRKMGPLGSLLKMMPGVGPQLGGLNVDEKELDRLEAIIRSMTPEERANPKIIDGSRRRRIARGSGTSVQAVVAARQAVRPDEEADEADRAGQDAEPAAAGRRSLTSSGLCPYESASPAWGARRIRSGAWSSPTSARRATAASSRRSATTTRRPSPRRSVIDEERFQHWVARGAQPTGTVKQLMKAQAKGVAGGDREPASAGVSQAPAAVAGRSRGGRAGGDEEARRADVRRGERAEAPEAEARGAGRDGDDSASE